MEQKNTQELQYSAEQTHQFRSTLFKLPPDSSFLWGFEFHHDYLRTTKINYTISNMNYSYSFYERKELCINSQIQEKKMAKKGRRNN